MPNGPTTSAGAGAGATATSVEHNEIDPGKTATNINYGVPYDIRQSVAIANVKSVAEQPAMLSNLSFSNLLNNNNLSQQNAVSFQQSMNQLAVTVTAKGINRISDLGPMEAVAVNEIISSNDLAEQIIDLKAATRNLNKGTTPSNIPPG
jgi:hypothetical protein